MGFGLCSNGSMSLMGSAVFYQCSSGDFYNLYSQSTGAQCIPIHIQATMSEETGPVSQISDGQPQSTSAGAVTQISDGQPQASTPGAVVTQISDGQPQASAPLVTQISGGQPQASAPIANSTMPPFSEFTGAASTGTASIGALAAGFLALFSFL